MAYICKLKANKIINEIMEQECLYKNERYKYDLTEKGLKLLQIIQKKNI